MSKCPVCKAGHKSEPMVFVKAEDENGKEFVVWMRKDRYDYLTRIKVKPSKGHMAAKFGGRERWQRS